MHSVGLYAQLACIWEATARKPGNVHRFQDFSDLTYLDFVLSAAAIAPVLDRAGAQRVGQTVLDGVCATRQVVTSNTNLGILLLFAPLAAVPHGTDLRKGVSRVLADLDVEDARSVYEAIRLAAPGGLGDAPEQDVRQPPTMTLWEVMALAEERDLVARQYANGFRDVFQVVDSGLQDELKAIGSLEGAIIGCHLAILADHPDTLIARKRGTAEAERASRWAQQILQEQWPHELQAWKTLAAFDAWLRAEGHSRNPGTTADLVAACLFVALREGSISLPPHYPWTIDFPP
jgi:triphosphoribosyl-dephospho-CoA synthase